MTTLLQTDLIIYFMIASNKRVHMPTRVAPLIVFPSCAGFAPSRESERGPPLWDLRAPVWNAAARRPPLIVLGLLLPPPLSGALLPPPPRLLHLSVAAWPDRRTDVTFDTPPPLRRNHRHRRLPRSPGPACWHHKPYPRHIEHDGAGQLSVNAPFSREPTQTQNRERKRES